jgi:hypothetical protein
MGPRAGALAFERDKRKDEIANVTFECRNVLSGTREPS